MRSVPTFSADHVKVSTVDQTTFPSSPVTRWFLRLAAIVILGIVAVTYSKAIEIGRLPPSHPYAAISLSLTALMLGAFSSTAARSVRSARVLFAVVGVMFLISAALWFLSASLRPSARAPGGSGLGDSKYVVVNVPGSSPSPCFEL